MATVPAAGSVVVDQVKAGSAASSRSYWPDLLVSYCPDRMLLLVSYWPCFILLTPVSYCPDLRPASYWPDFTPVSYWPDTTVTSYWLDLVPVSNCPDPRPVSYRPEVPTALKAPVLTPEPNVETAGNKHKQNSGVQRKKKSVENHGKNTFLISSYEGFLGPS